MIWPECGKKRKSKKVHLKQIWSPIYTNYTVKAEHIENKIVYKKMYICCASKMIAIPNEWP